MAVLAANCCRPGGYLDVGVSGEPPLLTMCDRVLPWCLWNSASSPLDPGDRVDFRCEGRALLTSEAIASTVGGAIVGRMGSKTGWLVRRGGAQEGRSWRKLKRRDAMVTTAGKLGRVGRKVVVASYGLAQLAD